MRHYLRHGLLLSGGMFLLMIFSGCERGTLFPEQNGKGELELTDGFCIQFSDSLLITHKEISHYDISTHIIYLKESQDFLRENIWDMAYWPFCVFAHRDTIYKGILWPAYASSIPTGAYIDFPFWYPDFTIRINHVSGFWYYFNTNNPDLRADERIINVLKEYGQYHEGLALTVDTIIRETPGELTFTFTVTNNDSYNYYILSPDEMGSELFHYFTNGLVFNNDAGTWLHHQLEVESPEPWDSWSTEWTELLESGKKRSFTVHYPDYDLIPPGEYLVSFYYPGLRNVNLEMIDRGDGFIWLGGIHIRMDLTVD